jgi:putative DNA primase/helicase
MQSFPTMQESQENSKFIEDKFRCLAWRVANGDIGQFSYGMENNQVYFFDNGYWLELREIEFLSKIENGLLDTKGNKILTHYDVQRRKKVIENYKILSFKSINDFNKYHLLNFENCMLDPIGLNVLPHDPKYLSTIRIPYKYTLLAECPLWIKTINEIFEKDNLKINILQEFFGQCLTRDIKQEKALLLLGESRSGKSTILNTLHNMVGIKNCSTVPLKYILNPVYTSMMIHKLINFDKDVSKKAQDYEEDFKKIVTGEEVTANDKYDDPFTFKPFCKMVLSANSFPRITDHSSALYNRLILIPCERVFSPEEQNRDLREQLLIELPGILNWALDGLKRLNKRGMFEEVNFMKNALKELEDENNPASPFFYDHLEIEEGAFIEKGELYDYYYAWAKKNGMYILSSALFSTALFKKYSAHTPKDTQHPQTRKRIWRGIKYVADKSREPIKQQVQWQD